MSKSHFHNLLSRYRNGQCTEREKRLVEQWLNLLDERERKHTAQEYDQIEDRIWNAINTRDEVEEVVTAHSTSLWRSWYMVAAAVVFLLMVVGIYTYQNTIYNGTYAELTEEKLPNDVLRKINNSGSPVRYQFSDGSTVVLNPMSSVEFPINFADDKREIFLTGKAFFDVERDPAKPFLVHSGDVVTKVLGTSFWVEDYGDEKDVEVSVVTGRVSVFQRDSSADYVQGTVKSGVVITANQRVKYVRENRAFVTTLVDKPVPVGVGENPDPTVTNFKFEDQPLGEILRTLELAYGIEIVLENENLNGCLFTGDIEKQPLFAKLDLVCSSVNASYEVRGTRILVSGPGCNSDNLTPKVSME
jgi:transmembrane sensor